MRYQIVYLPQTQQDLKVATTWYETQAGLGETFLNRYFSAIERLADNPFVCQMAFGEYQKLAIKQFPYHIFYKIQGNKVIVTAIFHQAKDPKQTMSEITQRKAH